MIALDICEPDTIEPTTEDEKKTAAKAPATPEQRQEIKEELTAPADNASALQIKGLKAVCKKLREAKPEKEELISKIAIDTEGFTKISKEDCEKLIEGLNAMMEEE